MKVEKRIALKGQVYAAPKTESVEIKNQGVLCGSGGVTLNSYQNGKSGTI